MYCLLCHEKIPRLRAWRTKSEFCSDEHAALYKKQTLERLLTDQNAARKKPPSPLPLAKDESAEFVDDEMSFTPVEPAAPAPKAQAPRPVSREDDFIDSFEKELEADPQEGVEELWRLAEEVGRPERGGLGYHASGDAPDDVRNQSAEDALRALRMLASKSSPGPDRPAPDAASRDDILQRLTESGPSTSRSGLDAFGRGSSPIDDRMTPAELPGSDLLDDDLLGDLDLDFASLDGMLDPVPETDFPADLESEEDELAAKSAAGEDDAGPSILERLLEDPTADWPAPDARSAQASEPAPAGAEVQPSLEDAPEPDFDFEEPLEVGATAGEPTVEDEDDPLAALIGEEIDDLDESGDDPLDELIRLEEAESEDAVEAAEGEEIAENEDAAETVASTAPEGEETAELDDAVIENVDFGELERSLKIVPFPGPSRDKPRNGTKPHAAEIAARSEEELEDNPLPQRAEAAKTPPAKPARPDRSRANKVRTRFRPSMVMAGVEPSLLGSFQGDPLETWRARAVASAWGEAGSPEAHGFEPPSPAGLVGQEVEAFGPDRRFQGRSGLPLTFCRPAEPTEEPAPRPALEAVHDDARPEAPRALIVDLDSAMALRPAYSVCEGVGAMSAEPVLGALAESSAGELDALRFQAVPAAPRGLFFDSVPPEERLLEDEEWEDAGAVDDGMGGVDLSDDFLNEQPATSSSAGLRRSGYR
ncbi:MAG: hypothetical protein GC160_10900 [Acidobacteria bacterium]|nr:hypothetical protein [Acidobacteriota bacterium]